MPDGWVRIWSESQQYMAELLRQKLEEQGVPVLVINKQDSSYLFGDIEIHVKGPDVIRAKHICKDHFQ